MTGPTTALARIMQLKGVIASVSLSHPRACTCDTCKAAGGDRDAFARVVGRLETQGAR